MSAHGGDPSSQHPQSQVTQSTPPFVVPPLSAARHSYHAGVAEAPTAAPSVVARHSVDLGTTSNTITRKKRRAARPNRGVPPDRFTPE